jgi:hypothetical protein
VRRFAVLFLVALGGLAGACTKVSNDPNAVVAISFDALPFPAVVVGDTLRDEAGVPVVLSAIALNPEGDVIGDAEITFLSLDEGGIVSPAGFVISNPGTATQMRVVAEAAGLQSTPLTVIITPQPDSIAQQGAVDTIRYISLQESTHISAPVTFKLFNNLVAPPVAARGWIVNFDLEYHGSPEPNATSTRAWLVDDQNRRSDKDTADAQGTVSRRLRIVPGELGDPDSVVVIASATHRGAPLAGSPVRVTVYLRAQ